MNRTAAPAALPDESIMAELESLRTQTQDLSAQLRDVSARLSASRRIVGQRDLEIENLLVSVENLQSALMSSAGASAPSGVTIPPPPPE